MTTTRTVAQKIGDWKGAFDVVRDELTPTEMRVILSEMTKVNGAAQLQSYIQLARSVMANDRAAATVAALLTQQGVKVTSVDYGDELD
jgi:hypothetical protein